MSDVLTGIRGNAVDCEGITGCPQLDHRELIRIAQDSRCLNFWFYDNFFPNRRLTSAKKFEVQELAARGRVPPAVFSAPCKPGEPLDYTQGGRVYTIDLANYKMWVGMDPCEVDKEIMFPDDTDPYERLSQQEKWRRHLIEKTAILDESVRTAYEIMAAMVKIMGAYYVQGPKINTAYYDFQRKPCLTVAAKHPWNNPFTYPVNDLAAYDMHFRMNSGVNTTRKTFGVDAYNAFMSHPLVIDKIIKPCDCPEPGASLNGALPDECDIEFFGRIGTCDLYVDARTYVDHDGMTKYYMPPDAVLFEGPGFEGTRAHGKIYSPEADFRSGDMFYREYVSCPRTQTVEISVEGSILLMPGNCESINRSMIVRGLGEKRASPMEKCKDVLLNTEGQIVAPPSHGSMEENLYDMAAAAVRENEYFEVCAALAGRTKPIVLCDDVEKCHPGEMCWIMPTANPCPDALQRCISKDTLIQQGIDEKEMINLVMCYALNPIGEPAPEQQEAPYKIVTPEAVASSCDTLYADPAVEEVDC
jgi:hypothetical protein